DLCGARVDANPVLAWGDCELRRYRQRLYCLPAGVLATIPGQGVAYWNGQEAFRLDDGSVLSASLFLEGLRADRPYRIGFRQPDPGHPGVRPENIRAQPHDRHHSQRLKKLLQEYALEPWLRNRVPLLWDGDHLAAVGDLWVEQGYFISRTVTDDAVAAAGMRLAWGWQID